MQIHTDHLGTPRAVSDSSNEILWRWEGDAFGTNSPSVELVKLPLRHAGQYHDEETGLFYNWHRFYDPAMGRYVTSDPLGLTDGTNPYVYVHGNPLSFTDPTGQFAIPLPEGIKKAVCKYGIVVITFNAGAGAGFSGRITITSAGVGGYVGVGVGVGLGASATVGAKVSNTQGTGIASSTSANAGAGVGGSANLTVGSNGASVSAGIGVGIGLGVVSAIGVLGTIYEFEIDCDECK